jgi:acyl-CoA reductase-like NAD-dependent aldehyde dehydrogenase
MRTNPLETAARARLAQGPWADAGISRRLNVVRGMGERLITRHEVLVEALVADGFSTDMARYWAAWITAACEPRKLGEDARLLARVFDTRRGAELVVRRPDGIVLLDPPANSATINTAPLFSILLPGNAVLVRTTGSRGQKLVVDEIVRPALAEAGFDPELVTLVEGRSRDVAGVLLPARVLQTVVFFGAAGAGAALGQEAFTHGTKLVAELGGSDYMAVWKDADLVRAVASAHRAWHVSTQPCLVPKHVLVHASVSDAFLERLLAELPAHARTVEADRETGRLVPVARMDHFATAFEELASFGRVRAGGHRMRADGTRDDSGPYVAPTVVEVSADVVASRPLLAFTEEIAFPLIPVVRFEGADDEVLRRMSAMMDASNFGLRASVWTSDSSVRAYFARRLGGVGILLFDDDHARSPEIASAWGGPKRSGGPWGECYAYAEKTSHAQSIVVGAGGRDAIASITEALGLAPDGVPA